MKVKKGINSMNTIGRMRVMLTAIAVIPLVFYLIVNNLMINNSLFNVERKLYEEELIKIKGYFEAGDTNLDNVTGAYIERYDILYHIKYDSINETWFNDKIREPATKYHGVDLILFLGSHGEIINSMGLKTGVTYNELSETGFNIFIKGKIDFKSNNWNKLVSYNNKLYRISASPIYDNNTGFFLGTMVFGIKVTKEFIQKLEKEAGWQLFINTYGSIISGDDTLDTIKYMSLLQDNQSNIISHMDQQRMIGLIPLNDIQGNTVAYLYAIIPRNIFPDTNTLIYRNGLLVLCLSVVFFLLLGWKFKKNITMPISTLEKQITKMAENNELDYVKVTGPNEINKLADSFNRMTQNMNIKLMENQSLKAELENDKIKTEFLANISHELRTPLNVILGILQLADLNRKNDISEDKKVSERYGKIIRQNCYRLLRMINNLIDITKISYDSFRIHLKNTNIVGIIEDIVCAAGEYVEGKGIHISLNKDVQEKIIACDAEQIERMMLNLLSNAIKFMTNGGNIIVGIKDEADKIVISVKDNGTGIPENQLTKIFDSFKQVDKSFTRNHEGSGIGLSLVKAIVDLHQGDISVKSKLKEGSEFIVELPVTILPEKNSSLKVINIEQNYEEKIHIEFSDINL